MGLRVRRCVSVFRHGDRSPSHNFFSNEEEESVWKSKTEIAEEFLEPLNAWFPISRKTIPTEHPVFGQLTMKGVEQLIERGRELRQRYDFNEDDVDVFSTNYTRTQQSAQSLLHGFFGSGKKVEIQVPHYADDIANAWDANDNLQKAVATASRNDSFFNDQEERFAATRKALTDHIPLYNSFPDKFLWIYSCDYFICRESHNLPILNNLQEHKDHTLNITAKRFLRWYHDPMICKLAAGGLLSKIKQHLTCGSVIKPYLLYSGHDITVLPLICAIGMWKEKYLLTSFEECWPGYASIITFELLVDDTDNNYFIRVLYNNLQLVAATPIDEFWEKHPLFPT